MCCAGRGEHRRCRARKQCETHVEMAWDVPVERRGRVKDQLCSSKTQLREELATHMNVKFFGQMSCTGGPLKRP